MDEGASQTNPDLTLPFHYGFMSHPCQMHEVPGQLSSLSSVPALSPFCLFHSLQTISVL